MSLPATDNFNRANSATLGANWTDPAPGFVGTPFQIASNTATNTPLSGSDEVAFWNADTFANNQYSQAKISVTVSAGGGAGVAVRVSASAATLYWAVVIGPKTGVDVLKFINGAATVLTSVPVTWVDGDTLKLGVVGNNLTVYQNGVPKATAIAGDSAIASGSAGLAYSSTLFAEIYEDWEGGNLVPSVDGNYSQFPKPKIREAALRGEI